jgi:hypothetical protein
MEWFIVVAVVCFWGNRYIMSNYDILYGSQWWLCVVLEWYCMDDSFPTRYFVSHTSHRGFMQFRILLYDDGRHRQPILYLERQRLVECRCYISIRTYRDGQ